MDSVLDFVLNSVLDSVLDFVLDSVLGLVLDFVLASVLDSVLDFVLDSVLDFVLDFFGKKFLGPKFFSKGIFFHNFSIKHDILRLSAKKKNLVKIF